MLKNRTISNLIKFDDLVMAIIAIMLGGLFLWMVIDKQLSFDRQTEWYNAHECKLSGYTQTAYPHRLHICNNGIEYLYEDIPQLRKN